MYEKQDVMYVCCFILGSDAADSTPDHVGAAGIMTGKINNQLYIQILVFLFKMRKLLAKSADHD